LEVILTKIVFTVFHNRASYILRGSKQWWTLASKISRGYRPSNPRRIDAYGYRHRFWRQHDSINCGSFCMFHVR